MEHDSSTVLVLLALRQLGGLAVPAKHDLFAKGLKKELQTAVDSGRVTKEKIKVDAVGPNGKPKKATIEVLNLTPAGEEALRQLANAEALAATAAADIEHSKKRHAATAAAELQAWKTRLEHDHQTLRAEIVSAGKAASSPAGVPDKDFASLAKSVSDLATKLEKIEKQLAKNNQEALLAKIDEGFKRLHAAVGEFDGKSSPEAAAVPRPPAHAPAKHHEPTAHEPVHSAASITDVLLQAYKDQCLDVEHTDGVVPLPRLYHQARSVLHNLSVEEFHRELVKLWDARQVDLMVLNEVRRATEPDKAIRRGDNLYYFVKWRNA